VSFLLHVATDDAEALTEIYTQSAKIGVTLLNMDVEKKRYYDTSKKDGGYTDEQHTVGALVGPGRCCSSTPLQRMPFNSRNEGLECVV